MNIHALLELIDDHRLDYHDRLNPKLWDEENSTYTLKQEVTEALNKIASRFAESLKIPDSALKDIVFTGSNANFNWTQYSDVDVHLMVDFTALGDCEDCSIDAEDCLSAKKSLWNDRHDIEIYDHQVEVYVSDAAEEIPTDAACYSLSRGEWIAIPQHKHVELDSELIKVKADEIAHEIDQVINTKTDDEEVIKDLTDRIWKYRQAGLQRAGEFSIENLVFKALRNNGYVQKIRDYAVRAQDMSLGLSEALNTRSEMHVEAQTPKFFSASSTIGGRKIIARSVKYDDFWEFQFVEEKNGKMTFKTTGSGSPLQVLAFVFNQVLREFIELYHPERIYMTAESGTKSRIYVKTLRKMNLNYELEVTKMRSGDDQILLTMKD